MACARRPPPRRRRPSRTAGLCNRRAPAPDGPSDKVDYSAPKGATATPKRPNTRWTNRSPQRPFQRLRKSRLRSRRRPPPQPAKPPAAATAKPSETAPAPVPAASAAGVPSTAQPGTWLVQVMATREQGIATAMVKKLSGKGYPAFLVNPVAGAPQAFYKVQIGRYKDRAEAERVSVRIEKEEKFQSLDFALALLSGALPRPQLSEIRPAGLRLDRADAAPRPLSRRPARMRPPRVRPRDRRPVRCYFAGTLYWIARR